MGKTAMGKTKMRCVCLLLAFLALASGAVYSQQELKPTANNGQQSDKPALPVPDKDGIYQLGPGITSPELVNAVPVSPADAIAACTPSITSLSAVIGMDGTAQIRDTYASHSSNCEALAIAAVKQSGFRPGMLNNKPVPVLVCIGVPFLNHIKPSVPELQSCPSETISGASDASVLPACPASFNDSFATDGIVGKDLAEVKPPKPKFTPEAEFTDEIRREFKRKHLEDFEATSLIGFIVDENGNPRDLCLKKAAGYGLDAQAKKAVLRYRFEPAIKDGKPVPMRLTVEIRFRLY
jgi:TonB family protein